jgi:hypothetical protein
VLFSFAPTFAQPLGPAFNCARVPNGLTTTICGSAELRRLDLELLQPHHALRHAQPQCMNEFRQQACNLVVSVSQTNGLPQRGAVKPEKLEAARSCIATAYGEQRTAWLH